MESTNEKHGEMDNLLTLMRRLRDPDAGCPWDLKQNFATIAPFTLEEAYEVVDAIEREDYTHLKEELGDLLFQVVYHVQMADEQGLFDFSDVAQGIYEKLLRRHPHVFPDGTLNSFGQASELSPEEIKRLWHDIKQQEKQMKPAESEKQPSAMPDDLPVVLPALQRAAKIQHAAAQTGFDWPDADPVFEKIQEEILEIKEARSESIQRVEEELGYLMFACVNLARHLGVDADTALRKATSKFDQRFRRMEQIAVERQVDFPQLSLDEMEAYWQQSKQHDSSC
ncbi:nucleoside triphosphate pyrophosphohydrolase [Endozoicomonas sp. (ex Bugula neritina AB1)]|nr:nucleoside triphosphate pyrophosphohydrolase [Endozoicomonas sp. (ex Bugula neritina AB1)]